ncbi:Serine-threonine/tyrosine-protein kinase, catalytic domain [Dillenia turbinata]|uniref:Serine-threonine/tyrosine-protein kinase, catalytic domain n=1 Tax=Dillenia turbinata TaxID=194707 RepID=A0AAN8VDY5_9MAGN
MGIWYFVNGICGVSFLVTALLAFGSYGFHVSPMQCNVSLAKSCPASIYYVPKTKISLEETATLFGVDSHLVNGTVDGFLITVNCSCLLGHDYFSWHTDYIVEPGDTWEVISAKFGSFVVQKLDKALIVYRTVTRLQRPESGSESKSRGCSDACISIELIGYAAGGEYLFLVYEFAQHGALTDHLQSLDLKGLDFHAIPHPKPILIAGEALKTRYKPLTWTSRVQIALDAAKGLEYIHMHTKPYYVHRNMKTSNILLSSNFHAKRRFASQSDFATGTETLVLEYVGSIVCFRDIYMPCYSLEASYFIQIADFGLVKLQEHSPEAGASVSRIVGTFGYLAPEYVMDGHVTTKTDVMPTIVSILDSSEDSLTHYHRDSVLQGWLDCPRIAWMTTGTGGLTCPKLCFGSHIFRCPPRRGRD